MTHIQKCKKTKFGTEGIFIWNLYDIPINVLIDDGVDLEYADKCVEHLQSLDADFLLKLYDASVRYCESCRADYDDVDVPIGINGIDILRYIEPKLLIIEKPKSYEPAFHMECNCSWEEEHGFEFTVRNGKLLYVGSFNDMGPWMNIDRYKASWNYAEI